MARRNVMIQGVADNNVRWATSNLQRYEALMRHRVESLRVANREMDMSIILHDLIEDRRRVEDLPLDVLVDVKALVDKRIKLVNDRLSKMEAAREPPAVPEIVLALMAEGAPPLGAPPAPKDLGGDAGEPRL